LVTRDGREKRVILRDLSSRGVGIAGNYSLDVGEEVAVTIQARFFFDQPIYRQAKVIWCQKIDDNFWQAGLDFGLDNKIDLFNILGQVFS